MTDERDRLERWLERPWAWALLAALLAAAIALMIIGHVQPLIA